MFKIKLFILFGILSIALLGLMAIAHEQVHQQIYKMYNIESHIEIFKYFPDIVTVADKEITTEDCPDACRIAHNLNEAISYPLIWTTTIIIMGFFYVLIYLQKILDKIEDNGISKKQ